MLTRMSPGTNGRLTFQPFASLRRLQTLSMACCYSGVLAYDGHGQHVLMPGMLRNAQESSLECRQALLVA